MDCAKRLQLTLMVTVRFHNEFGEKGVRALARGLRTFYFARKDEEAACVGVLVGKTRRLDLHSTLYGDFKNSGDDFDVCEDCGGCF